MIQFSGRRNAFGIIIDATNITLTTTPTFVQFDTILDGDQFFVNDLTQGGGTGSAPLIRARNRYRLSNIQVAAQAPGFSLTNFMPIQTVVDGFTFHSNLNVTNTNTFFIISGGTVSAYDELGFAFSINSGTEINVLIRVIVQYWN